jgi:hypothetical protein
MTFGPSYNDGQGPPLHAKMFWLAAEEMLLVKLPKLHPLTWFKDILCDPRFPKKDKAKITMVIYSIWSSRNNITHGDDGFHPISTMKFIEETLQTLDLSERSKTTQAA